MNDDIVARIKEVMNKLSMNSLSLSKALGYKSSEKISRLFRDPKNKPSFEIIYDISKTFEINADWLVTGRGEMNLTKVNTSEDPKQKNENPDLINQFFSIIADKDKKIEEQCEEIGRLKQENEHLKQTTTRASEDAGDVVCAGVG